MSLITLIDRPLKVRALLIKAPPLAPPTRTVTREAGVTGGIKNAAIYKLAVMNYGYLPRQDGFLEPSLVIAQ